MPAVEEVRTITAKGQRAAVVPDESKTDPALAPFLSLHQADLAARPAEAVVPLADAVARCMEALAGEVGEVDPDAPIEGEGAL